MKQICDAWQKEMREMRWERRFMIMAIVALVGVKLYVS